MNHRTSQLVVWLILALTLLGALVAIFFAVLNWNVVTQTSGEMTVENRVMQGLWLLIVLTFGGVSALVVSRRPENVIGWLLGTFAITSSVASALEGYLVYTLVTDPGRLAGAGVAAWFGTLFSEVILISELAALFLLLPNGHVLSRRWRWLLGLSLLGGVLTILGQFQPGQLSYYSLEQDVTIMNPFGIPGIGSVLSSLSALGLGLQLIALIGGIVCVCLRFKRSWGVERQQLKWFAFAGMIVIVAWVASPILSIVLGVDESHFNILVIPAFLSIPIATGIAILRHNLYDIDIILRRTLVYGALTTSLLFVYAVLVLGIGGVMHAALGADSSVAVAGATLAVAALFRPLRNRIQEGVDRRFNRQRYDAQRALDHFSTRLSQEIDLARIDLELRSIVEATMQPSHVSLWLKEPRAVPSSVASYQSP